MPKMNQDSRLIDANIQYMVTFAKRPFILLIRRGLALPRATCDVGTPRARVVLSTPWLS